METTIEVMNEVIAIFDGYERYEDAGGVWFKKEGLILCLHPKLQDLKYHESWDWLMPVWGSFRTIVADHFDEDFPVDYCAMADVWALECEHVNIHGAHKLLYDAIQWFNKQKEQ